MYSYQTIHLFSQQIQKYNNDIRCIYWNLCIKVQKYVGQGYLFNKTNIH